MLGILYIPCTCNAYALHTATVPRLPHQICSIRCRVCEPGIDVHDKKKDAESCAGTGYIFGREKLIKDVAIVLRNACSLEVTQIEMRSKTNGVKGFFCWYVVLSVCRDVYCVSR